MGVAELRQAFDEGADGAATCQVARLEYESHSDVQYQRLKFRGTDATGAAFAVESDLLRPETDVNLVAREMGAKMRPKEGPDPRLDPPEAGQ